LHRQPRFHHCPQHRQHLVEQMEQVSRPLGLAVEFVVALAALTEEVDLGSYRSHHPVHTGPAERGRIVVGKTS